jgi:tetratricopeptide (TPR) repeat protein
VKPRSTRPPADDPFSSALDAARGAPEDADAWEALEELAAKLQRPDEVAAVYLEVLRRGLPPAVATAIGQRAVKFQEEWFGEAHPGLVDVLSRVVAIAPTTEWAFERLTVALTMQEKWGDLLSAYDGALGADLPTPRRLQLLTEAAHLAKDLAGQPDRAIGYLQQILALKPTDAQSDAALERLLERQERWRDLVALWRTRLADLPPEEAQATRDRIATCLLDRLSDARGALEEVRTMAEHFPDDARALTLAEQILSGAATPGDVRRDALALLRSHHDRAGRAEEVVRALEIALGLAGREDKRAVHRELAERLAKLGRVAEAIGHEEAILVLEPPPAEELAAARHLAEITPDPARRVQLLERVAELETRPEDKREALGKAARLADELGQADRAIAAWTRRLEIDASDRVALDAIIELDERHHRWTALVEVLERRAASPVAPYQRRADLVRIAEVRTHELADVEHAIVAWCAVHRDFGEEPVTVDALADLYERAGRWDDLAAICERNARRESGHLVAILHRAGDTVWQKLGDPVRGAILCTAALEGDPAHEGARASLLALLADESARRIAVEALGRAAERTDDAALARRIAAHRVALAPEIVMRVRFLEESARREEAGGDPRAALEAMASALEAFPDDPRLAREVERLGAAARADDRAVAALRRAVALLPEPSGRAQELSGRIGVLLEERLDDVAGALAAYSDAGDRCRKGVVRTGLSLGRWDAVARTLVGAAVAAGALDEVLIALVEDSFETDWTELPRAVSSALAEARSVPSALAREIETRVATWHRDRAADPSAAQVALQRAIAQAPGHLPTLQELAALQRRTPGRPLAETLLQIAEATPNDLDPLEEAARLALGKGGDGAIARSALSTLAGEAQSLLRRGRAAAGQRSALDAALWSLEALAKIAGEAGEQGRQVELLVEAARLALDPEVTRRLRREAAEVASGKAGDRRRAVDLYEGILAQSPDDTGALEALAPLFEADGRLADLLALRRHELGLGGTSVQRRVALRLEVSRLVGEIEESGGRVASLRQNLDEVPGHDASVVALEQVLTTRGQFGELTDVLTDQAARLEGDGDDGDRSRAAHLWGKVARLAEERLADAGRAIAAHRKVTELDATPESLEALARLLVARGEHEQAIPFLARRLETAEGLDRTAMALRLADAYLATGRPLGAVECLERALSAEPTAHGVRRRLSDLYWTAGSWASLARLLIEGCAHAPDSETIVAWAREAAEIHSTRLGTPDQAISALERAHAIAPEDRGLKGLFAAALRAAGRLPEARKLLEELLAEFGRRRSPERAAIHLELARLAHAEGRAADALAELEQAASMDVSNVRILRTLAELARDSNEMDRAERAYRSLLFILRRQKPEDRRAGETMATSEVLYELHRLAVQRGQADAAKELLESALESATASTEEVEALSRVLEVHGDRELLLRAIRMRLEASHEDAEAQARGLSALADVLDALGRGEEALESRLDALEHAPGSPDLHDLTRATAMKVGETERYVVRIVTLVDQGRRREDAALVADLLMRAGAAVEKDLGDLVRARELYVRADSTGAVRRQALEALARVAGGLGDRKAQLEALHELARGGSAESLYALAEGQLGGTDTLDEGLQTLTRALELDAQHDRAMRLLDAAKEFGADVARVLPLYEHVARNSGDPRMLLDFLERRATLADATPEHAREAIEVSLGLGLEERAETLRRRAVDLARASSGGVRRASWALLPLAQASASRGAREEALVFWLEAETVLPHEEVRAAGLALAGEWSDAVAARVFERLLAHDPSAREVWEPLARLYESGADAHGLDELCLACLDALVEPASRNALRMARARVLSADHERADDAVAGLREVLAEEPDHPEATALYASLLERGGRDTDLGDLLWRQLDAARDKGDLPTLRALAVRLGGLLERHAPGDAKLVYRTALAALPGDQELLRAALRLIGPEDDPGERAGLIERVLSQASGLDAAPLVLEVAQICTVLGDDEGLGRALAHGHREAPDDDGIRNRLERYYRDQQDFPRLAEMLADAASRVTDGPRAVALWREAATLLRDLGDPVGAAALLRRARQTAPSDLELVEELVACLRGKGDLGSGIDEIGGVLETIGEAPAPRIRLLRLRSELHRTMRDDGRAVADLEDALALGGREVLDDLLALLEQTRTRAGKRQDHEAERAVTLRLATLHLERGADDEAGAILAVWIDRSPSDAEALRLQAELQESMGDWEALALTATRLVEVEEGDAQLQAGLRLAAVCRKLERPGEARAGLEHVAYLHPGSEEVREHLRRIYEETGADRELAELLLQDAETAAEEGPRFARLRQAGVLFLGVAEPTRAAQALEAALALRPGEHDTTMLLVDAYGQEGRFAEASQILQTLIAAQRKKRSPEMSALLQRMANLASYEGDRAAQIEWLRQSLEADKNNGAVAVELADVAEEMGDWDTALKALQAVTLMKTSPPISHPVAFLRQARIAYRRGEKPRAVLWAKRALVEDPGFVEATRFLKELGEG